MFNLKLLSNSRICWNAFDQDQDAADINHLTDSIDICVVF